MKARPLLLLAGCCLPLAMAAMAANAPSDDAQRVFAQVSPSVVTVRLFDEQGLDLGLGSGVVIGTEQVATNCHVVQEAASLRVTNAAGEFAGQWVRQDPQRDICLLAVKGLVAPPARLRHGDSLVVGESVFAVGNPLGFGLAVSAGLVTAIDTKEQPPVLIASAALSPGSSGGGMFDREGRLVGITTAVLGTGQNLNLVLSSDGLDILAVTGHAPRPPVAPPEPEHRWQEEAVALQQANAWHPLAQLAQAWHAAQPSSAAALTFLGVAQQALDQHKEAVANLRLALDLDDHYAFAWLIYGTALKGDDHPDEATQALARAEALLPIYAQPHAVRSLWALQEGHLEEAHRQAQESLRLAPGNSAAWRNLGLIEDARGHQADALHAFQTAVRLGDANADVRQRLAQLLAGAGKADEASRVSAQANLGKKDTAQTQVAIGLAEMQRNRLMAAEEALRKAIALAPDLADGWSGLGSVLVRSKRLEEAEKAYDQALQLTPDKPETLTNRAITRHALGHTKEALEDVHRALANQADYVPAWRLYGTLQMASKNFPEAVLAFTRIDGLGQATADDLVSLGESLAETGQVQRGLATLVRAEALDPKLVRLCLSMARVLGQQGDISQALTYLDRALQIEPSNHMAWSSKGYGLMKLGRLAQAVQALETTVTLAPEFSNGWINLGEAQLRSKNLGQAIQALEKATVLAPKAVDARLFLAQAYLGTRQPEKSRAQAQWLLSTTPDFAPALGLLTMSYLMEANVPAAREPYLKLKAAAPGAARSFRSQAIAAGVTTAKLLPE